MWQERLGRYLLTADLEKEAEFRGEVLRLSHSGLRVIGAIEIAASAFMFAANLILAPNAQLLSIRLRLTGLLVCIGLITLAGARFRPLYERCRLFALLSGLATTIVLISNLLQMAQILPTTKDFIPGHMTLVMFITVTALPLRPLQTFVYGFLMQAIYLLLAYSGMNPAGADSIYVVYLFMMTMLATAITAVMYNQRRSAWEWHTRTLQAAENLRHAETRNLLAQSAASAGRLAAALSHELNSPIGALVSGVDTLLLLASRQATSGGIDQGRLVLMQNELRKSIRESSGRLREIVARMQRFTNLDKAEVQAANLNEILTDVTAIVEPGFQGRAKVELDLQPVPELVCRPQQLSAVFSNLLGNALEAINGDGRVRVATRQTDDSVEVHIEDNGRGLDKDQLESIFDPGFRISHGRVATGNWSMFSSRQIIREHGGDIHINSSIGKGTCVQITLPLEGQLLS